MTSSGPCEGRALLLTGATGFLGSHFLLRLLQEPRPVFALVRGSATQSAQERLEAALTTARSASQLHPAAGTGTVRVVNGDIGQPLSGVAEVDLRALRAAGVEQVWHFASDLRYEEGHRKAIWYINVEGARHALALARAIDARRFVYVSTAYTAGIATGTVPEYLHPLDGPFNNVYEASKCAAEHMLWEACADHAPALTIVRPSVVVGPRSSKRPDGSETGLYGFIRAMKQLKASLAGTPGRIHLPSHPDAEINFIPVDCVVDDMLALMSCDFGPQPIYHLTSSRTVTASECWSAISAAIGLENVLLKPRGSFEATPVERLLQRRIGFFLDYIGSTKHFERHLSSRWEVGQKAFAEYVSAALSFNT